MAKTLPKISSPYDIVTLKITKAQIINNVERELKIKHRGTYVYHINFSEDLVNISDIKEVIAMYSAKKWLTGYSNQECTVSITLVKSQFA